MRMSKRKKTRWRKKLYNEGPHFNKRKLISCRSHDLDAQSIPS